MSAEMVEFARMAGVPLEPWQEDVVRIEAARLAEVHRIATPEAKGDADLRRLGLLPAASFGLPVVLDGRMPENVVRLVARDGSWCSYDLNTGTVVSGSGPST